MRLGLFLLTLLLFWLPIAVPIYLLVDDPNLVTILTMAILFAEFLFLLRCWGKKVDKNPHVFASYGLGDSKKNALNLITGLSIGLLITLSLFFLKGLLGWLEFQKPQVSIVRIIFEGLLSALGIALAEELVFRGWLLNELERDYSLKTALWLDAVIFAVSHFLKPLSEIIRTLIQFPALVLLGLTLVWARRSQRGRLGLPIGLHAGLVCGYYIISVGQLVQYTDQVSPWITGVDGNPIAGCMGMIFLGVLALWMQKLSVSR